jgi:hypothetical protein
MSRRYLSILVLLVLLSPLGLLAKGTAWGEWGAADIQDSLGYIPQGMERFGDFWQALFPDYSLKFFGQGAVSEQVGYIFSAVIGSVIIYFVILAITKLVIHEKIKQICSNK